MEDREREKKERTYDYLVKLLLIGDSGVGKSCMLLQFVNKEFTESFLSTIGIDFKVCTVKLKDETRVKLQIWDTAGQERFRSITRAYYKGSHALIIVYDVTDRGSFNDVHNWIRNVDDNCNKNICAIIIGNKCDLADSRQVTFEEGKALADHYNVKFYETSAKNGLNIENLFTELTEDVIKKFKDNNLIPMPKIDLNKKKKNKLDECCK